MQSYNHGTDSALAGVNARVQHAGVRLAEPIDGVFVQNPDYFVEPNLGRGSRQSVAAVCPTLRLHQAGLDQNPHQLAGVGDRKPFPIRDLIQRQ